VVSRIEGQAAKNLRSVVNATGVILHTNLGRAPLGRAAFEAAWEIGRSYSNLEYDLVAGERGSRYERASSQLCELTGAADAIVVNNCAAAVLLIVETYARGAEVVVARSQLVEIGGGFRLPDILERGGACLVEAGTTNKVYAADYETALSPRTALLLRSHRSNFTIDGFVHDTSARELVELGARAGVCVAEDLGSGALVDVREYGLPYERTVPDAIADGVALVAFSADKLLGGPQAGIVVGSRAHIARLRANPLVRALRVDKVTLALLSATLALYRSPETRSEIPLFRMLGTPVEDLRVRAGRYRERIPTLEVLEARSQVGGGAAAGATLPSIAVAISTPFPDELALRLRAGDPPIVARVAEGALLLDLRTIAPDEDVRVMRALDRLDDR